MKKILFFVAFQFLFLNYFSQTIRQFNDTLYQNDSIFVKYDVWLRFNGPNPSNCSPLISALDTVNPSNISIDFLYDITGGSNPNGCLKTDSLRIFRQLSPGVYTIICYWSIIESLAPPGSYSPRYASDTVLVTVLNTIKLNENNFSKFSIAPNPVRNELRIKNPENLNLNAIEIWELNGRLVYNSKKNKSVINVSHLNQGIYLLKTYTEQGIQMLKFVKE